ncbi:MAG: acetyltransferase [Spirochaetales bacterium]|nr:acetyltransferase [Spirochaetales bacterium]
MNKPLIIIGAGDHAKVLLNILLEQGEKVLGLADKSVPKGTIIYGIPVIGDDNEVLKYSPEEIELVNGIGSIRSLALREKIYTSFKNKGYTFKTVIHHSAKISKRARIFKGVQVLQKAVINTEAQIGENTIINFGSIVEHGCKIEKNFHIASGCTLSGCVKVGDNTHVGTGSSIIQGITIGSNVLLGVGSVVVKDIRVIQKHMEYQQK